MTRRTNLDQHNAENRARRQQHPAKARQQPLIAEQTKQSETQRTVKMIPAATWNKKTMPKEIVAEG